MRECRVCGNHFPVPDGPGQGRKTYCSDECRKTGRRADANARYWADPDGSREKAKKWNAKSRGKRKKYYPDSDRAHHLRTVYGITLDQYDQMWTDQAGGCAICGESCPTGRRLAVDHDHETGQVRGLLCARCNNALGNFRDNASLLRRAISYLEEA